MATSLCQSPTWKPFSQVQRGGWRSFAHLPAAFLFVLASLCRCFLYKECLGKVCIEPKQKREAVAYPLSMGTAPWQWNPTETEDASLSLVTARHCLWLGPLWHKCTPMYLYIIKRFQSKTITQKMHWGRGWENKQEPDVWPVLSRTAEGSWAAQDESLQTLELHKVLRGTTARCCHRTLSISLRMALLSGDAQRNPSRFSGLSPFSGLWQVLEHLYCGDNRAMYLYEASHHHGGTASTNHPSLLKDNLSKGCPYAMF